MEVELISYSQPAKKDADKNPLSIAELAASVCYDSEPTETYRIAKGCKATGHTSVLEHIWLMDLRLVRLIFDRLNQSIQHINLLLFYFKFSRSHNSAASRLHTSIAAWFRM